MRGRAEHLHPVADAVHGGQDPTGVAGGLFEITDIWNVTQCFERGGGEIRVQQARVGVQADRRVHRLGDSAEVALDSAWRNREERLQNQYERVRAKLAEAGNLA